MCVADESCAVSDVNEHAVSAGSYQQPLSHGWDGGQKRLPVSVPSCKVRGLD